MLRTPYQCQALDELMYHLLQRINPDDHVDAVLDAICSLRKGSSDGKVIQLDRQPTIIEIIEELGLPYEMALCLMAMLEVMGKLELRPNIYPAFAEEFEYHYVREAA